MPRCSDAQTDGGTRDELQCLNDPGCIEDMTFIAQDVPEAIARVARVQPLGQAWGVAGDRRGGYCAANIALQDPRGYGAAGVLSGYFAPVQSHVPAATSPEAARPVDVFLAIPACG